MGLIMPIGPNGEKRPVSSVSSMVMAMRVATGIEEEQYADGKPHVEGPVAAMQVAKPKKSRKRKRRTGRPR